MHTTHTPRRSAQPFYLEHLDPEAYRHKTRLSSLILILIFSSLAMGCATLFVALWGQAGSNFHLNFLGVATGLVITLLLVKFYLSDQALMREAVYAWRLKRELMRITNQMHSIKTLTEQARPEALLILRFYHLALTQMHKLEGNDVGLLELKVEEQALLERLNALELPTELDHLDPAWWEAVSAATSR